MEAEVLYPAVLLLLLALSGIFSASETAFFSLNLIRLERLAKGGDRRAEEILKLLQNPAVLIATILLGNEFVNVSISAVFTVFLVKLLGEKGSIVAFPVTVVSLLIFGEVIPKTLAFRFNEKYARLVYPFIKSVSFLVFPAREILAGFAGLVLKPFRVELYGKRPSISDEDFMILISESARGGSIVEEEKSMMQRVLDLGETKVEAIMTPREKIFALERNTTVEEALDLLKNCRFSRIPVFSKSIDNIIGILYAKKLIPLKGKKDAVGKKIGDLCDKAWFVSPSVKLTDLLEEMQRSKKHMAIVAENRKVLGLVTLDDVLLKVVGEGKWKSSSS